MYNLYIGNKNYSSWSLRPWLLMQHFGIPFREHLVSVAGRPFNPALKPLAGNGRVPCLHEADGFVVWDSLAIIEYLNEKSGGDKFWPFDEGARAMARSMAAEMHSGFAALRREHSMNIRQIYPPKEPSDEVKADITRIMELWAQARARHGGEGDFLFGDFGAADIMYAPVVTRFITYSLPVAQFAVPYMQAVIAHPFMQDWIAAAQAEDWVIEKFEAPVAG